MRLRRLEMAILALTLAFAFFMGGYFTGRITGATGSVTVDAYAGKDAVTQTTDANSTAAAQATQEQAQQGQSQAPATEPKTTAGIVTVQQTPSMQPANDEGNASQGTGAPRESDGKININTAGAGELTDLPGIGDVIAARIIEYRTQNGRFTGIEEIQNVSGIGEKKFAAIKDLITVGERN